MTSELEEVPGVGPKTLQKLLRHFGSLERVKQATESELIEIAGRTSARRIIDHFSPPSNPEFRVLQG
jgi:excinuclease ABC subunit C